MKALSTGQQTFTRVGSTKFCQDIVALTKRVQEAVQVARQKFFQITAGKEGVASFPHQH